MINLHMVCCLRPVSSAKWTWSICDDIMWSGSLYLLHPRFWLLKSIIVFFAIKGSPRSASLDKFMCSLEGSSWVYGWTAWQFFLQFFLLFFKMGLVCPTKVLDLYIMFQPKKQRWPLHQICLEMHWGGDPLQNVWKFQNSQKLSEKVIFFIIIPLYD